MGHSDHIKDLFGGRSFSIDVGCLDCAAGEGDGVVRATLYICGLSDSGEHITFASVCRPNLMRVMEVIMARKKRSRRP